MRHHISTILLLLLASTDDAQDELNKHLITDFGQTVVSVSSTFSHCTGDNNQGNCATIALVKTALAEFKSLSNIYKEFKPEGDSFHCRFNDDIEVFISKQDIQTVKDVSGIANNSNSVYYDSALIIYSSICKRVLLNKYIYANRRGYNNPACINTFRDAVDYLNSGYPTATVGELLGFKMELLSSINLHSEPAVIINDAAHAAYCSNGVQDILGKPFTITGNRMENPRSNFFGSRLGKITGVFRLKK